MTKVIVAREAGACYGVERALELVRDVAARTDGPVHTLGPLIHNPVVVAELEELGVTVAKDADVEPGSTLVLRTHGVAPEVEEQARAAGASVVDATCPFVKRVHRSAERLVREGYQLVVVGESGHPEVEGIVGHAPGATVVGSPSEVDGLELGRKVGVVVQTTQARANLQAIVAALAGRADELRVINTICDATAGHQGACAELAAAVDVMIVVGGHNSANTTHLAEISRERCPRTHHIELPSELDDSWFAEAERIGVTAGASTPSSHIEAVVDAIRGLTER